MKSEVIFDLVDPIPTRGAVEYESLGVRPLVEDGLLRSISVEIVHKQTTAPADIVERARKHLRDIVTLLGVGFGFEPFFRVARLHYVTPRRQARGAALLQVMLGAAVARRLTAMPDGELIHRLAGDHRMRRQAEALNAARVTSDLVTRFLCAYKVLEQEKKKNRRYQLSESFRRIRNVLSHAEPESADKDFLMKALGSDTLDVQDASHVDLLRAEAQGLLAEATRIVEDQLLDKKFWV